METIDNEINDVNGIQFSDQIKRNLIETGKWTNFLAIVGFVILGLILIGAFIFIGLGASAFNGEGLVGVGVLYILMVVLYFFPTFYLLQFARKIKTGLSSSIQSEVETAFLNLKKLFKFVGILMIITISLYLLIIIFVVLNQGF